MGIEELRTFETGDFSEGFVIQDPPNRSNAAQVQSAHKRAGNFGCKLDLRADDDFSAFGARTELTLGNSFIHPLGVKKWYGWSIKLEGSTYAFDKEPEIISQWHAGNGESPPLSIWIEDAKFRLRIRPIGFVWELPQIVDTWLDWVLEFIPSKTNSGLVRLWLNGTLRHEEINQANVSSGNSNECRFRFGIYKWRWKLFNGPSDVAYRKLYVDEIRVGDQNSNFDEVKPAGGAGAPSNPPPENPPAPPPPATIIEIAGTELGFGLYIPQALRTVGHLFGAQNINVALEGRSTIVQAPKSGNIRKIHFRTGTVSLGATIDIRLETVVNNLPTGNLISANSRVDHLISDTDDDKWHISPALVQDAIVTRGQDIAVCFFNSNSNPGNINFSTMGNIDDHERAYPYGCQKNTSASAWQNNVGKPPIILLEYSDGSVEEIPYIWPLKDSARNTYDSAGFNSMNEVALKFKLNFACRVIGYWLGDCSSDNDDAEIILYDNNNRILSLQIYKGYAGRDMIYGAFPTQDQVENDAEEIKDPGILIQANQTYRLSVRARHTGSSLNRITTSYGECESAAIMAAWNGGTDFSYSERAGEGQWTDFPLRRPYFGLIINHIFEAIGPPTPETYDLIIDVPDAQIIEIEQPIVEAPISPSLKRFFVNNWAEIETSVDTVYQTDIIESDTSAEERKSLVSKPFRRLQTRFTGLSQEDTQRLLLNLTRFTSSRFEFPIYSDISIFSADALSTDTVIQCDTRFRRLYIGNKVHIFNGGLNIAAFLTITDKTDTTLTLSGQLGQNFPRGTLIFPAIIAEKVLSQDFETITDYISDGIVSVKEVLGINTIQPTIVGLPSEPTHNSLPVFTIPLDWSENIQIAIERQSESYSQGRDSISDVKGLRPKFIFNFRSIAFSRQDAWRMLSFFDSRKGRFLPFWTLIPNSLWLPTNIQTTFIDIKKTSELSDISDFFDYIAIRLVATGEVLIREINDVTDQGSVFRINLVTALPSAYNLSEISLMTSAHLTRFEQDFLTELWQTNEVCIFQFSTRELLNEKIITIPTI